MLPNAELHTVPRTSHQLMQEQPELVLAKVRHLSIMGGLHRTEQPDGEGGVLPRMRNVFRAPAADPDRPWICATNDWGAVVLPDGGVLAVFGRRCLPHADAEAEELLLVL